MTDDYSAPPKSPDTKGNTADVEPDDDTFVVEEETDALPDPDLAYDSPPTSPDTKGNTVDTEPDDDTFVTDDPAPGPDDLYNSSKGIPARYLIAGAVGVIGAIGAFWFMTRNTTAEEPTAPIDCSNFDTSDEDMAKDMGATLVETYKGIRIWKDTDNTYFHSFGTSSHTGFRKVADAKANIDNLSGQCINANEAPKSILDFEMF